jgi:RNase adaptor protein for sRNA GlmZ degradation
MITDGGRGPVGFAGRSVQALVLLVTRTFGAGRSTALKALEDIGYGATDNLPPSLFPRLVGHAAADAIAADVDTRTRGFGTTATLKTHERVVSRTRRDLKVLFVDCEDELLARRYTEIRRPHPLASDRSLFDAIRSERQMISVLREQADLVVGRLWQLLRLLLPRYERESKIYLTIAIGCTGGRHRSVFVAERLAALLRMDNLPAEVAHRDLPASSSPPPLAATASDAAS